MSFLTPLAFLFALSLPAVVVFYLLKRKRVVKLVPSTLLWQKFLAETQASAPFQKLRHNWLLLLQLLLLLLLVIAISRPYFAGKAGEGSLQVVILDASASMQATDETPSRFEKARADALRLVDGLLTGVEQKEGRVAMFFHKLAAQVGVDTGFGRRNQEMMIMVAGANTEVLQSSSTAKAVLRRALESAKVTDSPTRLAEALRVAETLTRDRAGAEIHLFSDGAGVDLSEFESKDLKLSFHRVGSRGNNAAVTTLDVKPNPEDPTRRAIFTSVANYGLAPVDATLELRFDDQVVETKAITVGPTNTTPVVFVAGQPQDGVFTVKLNHADDLAADNEARVVSRLPLPVRVLLVTKGNRFLEKALVGAGPNVELATATDFTDADAKFDLVALDDITPTVWPGGNVLAIHVANTNWFDGGIGALDGPAIVDWRNTHPLLRFVSFDNVQIAQSLAVKTPTWAVALVDSPQAPLVLAGELGRQRIVWIGFDTLQSTWPLRISYPIFLANVVDWLNPASATAAQFSIRAGDAFRMPLGDYLAPGAGALTARITPPGGPERTIPLDATARELVFGDTGKQGVYRVTLGTNQLAFAANLLDPVESNLKPRDELSLGRRGEVTATTLKRANLEYWRWFALAGLGVMMVEWWWFHRRTA